MYSFIYPNLRAEFGRQALTVSGVAESIGTTRARLSCWLCRFYRHEEPLKQRSRHAR